MSISLVLFRLEVADDCKQLVNINYNGEFYNGGGYDAF